MKKGTKKWWIVVAVLLVAAAFAVLFFMQYGKKNQSNGENRKNEIEAAGNDGELVDYEANGMLTLGKYMERPATVKATETEVYQSILLEAEDAHVNAENADRVMKGDWISLDYEGYIDEQPVEDLNESGAVIQVGAGNLFNAAFERGLLGLKTGETYNLTVSFPEEYMDAEVAGETVTFSVEVTAKFNDDYAKAMSKNKYKTVEEYFQYAKAKEEQENRDGIGDTVWEDLMKDCKVKKYPEGSRSQAYKDQKRSYRVFARASGITYENFIGNLGYTDEDIHSMGDDSVKARMVAKTIAAQRKLTMSDAEYERLLCAYLEPEEDEDKTIKAMEKRYLEEQSSYPRDDMLVEFVKQYIGKHAKIK